MSRSSFALAFAPGYDFQLPHFEGTAASGNAQLFDGKRASRALAAFEASGGEAHRLCPTPVTRDQLERIHAPSYLDRLDYPRTRPGEVAEILEIPAAARASAEDLERFYLAPMRLGTGGSLAATAWVLEEPGARIAVNLSGGYHHAMADRGTGFCAYNDLALAAELATRVFGLKHILCIDLDAHQGNGTARIFRGHERWALLDLYNQDIWPGDEIASAATRHLRPLPAGMAAADYLATLDEGLHAGLAAAPELVLYNAGTDVLDSDPLGGFKLSLPDVRERDRRVLAACSHVPVVTFASGGYTDQSHLALAGLLAAAAAR